MYTLIYKQEEFIIISKKHGYEFHGEGGILAALRVDFKEVYGVHRLDKETSGLMVFALTKKFQSEISIQFANKKVTKTYIALSDKKPRKKQRTCSKKSRKRARCRHGGIRIPPTKTTKFIFFGSIKLCFSCKAAQRYNIFIWQTSETKNTY